MQVGTDTPEIQRAKKASKIASQVSTEWNIYVIFKVKYNQPYIESHIES